MLPAWLKYDLQRRWEQFHDRFQSLGLRGLINDRPQTVMAVAAGSVLALIVVAVFQLLPDRPPPTRTIEKEWYYDLNTGELFVADSGLTPPIEAPSGPRPTGEPAGVRAYVLTCAEQPNEPERFIRFLETTAPKETPSVRSGPSSHENAAIAWARGKLIRRLSDRDWVPADSPEGQLILTEAFAPDADGERPSYDHPD